MEMENKPKKKDWKKMSFGEIIKKILVFFTVEPFLICYVIPSALTAIAVQRLNTFKACVVDLNYTQEICNRIAGGDTDSNDTMDAGSRTQVLLADMEAWKTPLQMSIPAIFILFVGAWSDKTGNRKALMLLPALGEIVSLAGLIMATFYLEEWPLWITGLIEALPSALSGGASIALMGAFSYIADVTTIESRTFRMGIVSTIATLGLPIGASLSGVLTKTTGYYGVFSVGLCLYLIGFIHTFFAIKNVKQERIKGNVFSKIKQFFDLKNVKDTFSVIVARRGKMMLQVILVIATHIVVLGPALGEAPLQNYYFVFSYGMDEVQLSLFATYMTLMGIAGTIVVVTIFSKLFKMHDGIIGMVSVVSKAFGSVMYSLAPSAKWLYAAPALDFLGNSSAIATRSLATKVVDPENVGKICSLIGFVESIIPVIYSPIYSKMYGATADTFPGAFYILGACMTLPGFCLFLALYIMHRQQRRNIVEDPTAKEKYSYDNEVTPL